MRVTVKPIVVGVLAMVSKGLESTGGFRNERDTQDHLDPGFAPIGQNTQNSPGNVRRLAVT